MTRDEPKSHNEAFATTPVVATISRVLWGSDNVRMIFGDQAGHDMPVHWHTQIAMSHANASALRDLLVAMSARAKQIEITAPAPPPGRAN